MTTLAEIEAAATALTPEDRKHLEEMLREIREREHEEELQAIYKKTGLRPLPKQPNGRRVTDEDVQRIREEEGI